MCFCEYCSIIEQLKTANMSKIENSSDKDTSKSVSNGVEGIDLGEHYLVMRTDGSWRKFLLSKAKQNIENKIHMYYLIVNWVLLAIRSLTIISKQRCGYVMDDSIVFQRRGTPFEIEGN